MQLSCGPRAKLARRLLKPAGPFVEVRVWPKSNRFPRLTRWAARLVDDLGPSVPWAQARAGHGTAMTRSSRVCTRRPWRSGLAAGVACRRTDPSRRDHSPVHRDARRTAGAGGAVGKSMDRPSTGRTARPPPAAGRLGPARRRLSPDPSGPRTGSPASATGPSGEGGRFQSWRVSLMVHGQACPHPIRRTRFRFFAR